MVKCCIIIVLGDTMSNKRNRLNNIPKHVAIIMDGNGRWAQKRGLDRTFGHKKGAERLYQITMASVDLGVKVLTVYAFSVDNWKRPQAEVNYLMNEASNFLKKHENDIINKGIKVVIIGEDDKISEDLRAKKYHYMDLTKNYDRMTLVISLNYGSHQEIVKAVKTISEKVKNNEIDLNDINEQLVEDNLYTKDLPPVDFLIRTSGEIRLSNFLLWQISYAEMYFTKVLWPDFNVKEYTRALEHYQNRKRRFGGLTK